MFKFIYLYYYNLIDTPSSIFKLNLWSYVNIKLFKIKITQVLTFFICGLITFQQKQLKIFHKNFNFDYNYRHFFTFVLMLLFLIWIF